MNACGIGLSDYSGYNLLKFTLSMAKYAEGSILKGHRLNLKTGSLLPLAEALAIYIFLFM